MFYGCQCLGRGLIIIVLWLVCSGLWQILIERTHIHHLSNFCNIVYLVKFIYFQISAETVLKLLDEFSGELWLNALIAVDVRQHSYFGTAERRRIYATLHSIDQGLQHKFLDVFCLQCLSMVSAQMHHVNVTQSKWFVTFLHGRMLCTMSLLRFWHNWTFKVVWHFWTGFIWFRLPDGLNLVNIFLKQSFLTQSFCTTMTNYISLVTSRLWVWITCV